MRVPIRARSAALLLALAVPVGAAGCGAGPQPAPGSPGAPLTVQPSGRGPVPTLPPSSPRVLAAAPYAIETMRPHFSLNLPEGFVLQQLAADQFFITPGPDSSGGGLAIVRLASGDLVTTLPSTEGLVGQSVVDVQIGSLVGHSISLTAASGVTEPPLVLSSAEFATPYVLPLGAQGRVIEFTISGGPVAVFYFAPAADFAAFEGRVEGILGSLAFRP